jgi:uncharacterized protein (UPF0305 family)
MNIRRWIAGGEGCRRTEVPYSPQYVANPERFVRKKPVHPQRGFFGGHHEPP